MKWWVIIIVNVIHLFHVESVFVSRSLQSLSFPASRVRHRQHRRVIAIHLLNLLTCTEDFIIVEPKVRTVYVYILCITLRLAVSVTSQCVQVTRTMMRCEQPGSDKMRLQIPHRTTNTPHKTDDKNQVQHVNL